MAWPCPHWPQTVFFGGDAGEEQCSWGPPDSRARSPTGRSQGSGKRHGDVEEYPSADRDRFFIGKKAPFLHYFLGPSDVRWQTLPTLKREDPKKYGSANLSIRLPAKLKMMQLGEAIVPDLTRILDGGDLFQQRNAAVILGLLRRAASSAVPNLEKAAKSNDALL